MRTNVKDYMMALIVGRNTATRVNDLDGWVEATASIPEWHAALVAEWHARNFSQDEADEVNGTQAQYLRPELPSIARMLTEMALERMGASDEV